jgi:peptidoglycan hydrolase-like protein with peptidoglycan-binding domain
MLIFRASLALIVSAALITPSGFASRVHRAPTSGQTTHKGRKTTQKSPRSRGQQAIEPERVTQIQQALIREHYLSGEATGKWDAATAAAMQKYQADQGWQTKLMPDSRAIKKLGLGPDYSGAINAKNSTFAAPPPASTIPADQVAGFTAASGVSQ